jgi:hypothetical protein
MTPITWTEAISRGQGDLGAPRNLAEWALLIALAAPVALALLWMAGTEAAKLFRWLSEWSDDCRPTARIRLHTRAQQRLNGSPP